MSKPFTYIGPFKYSNCLVEALKAKIHNPSVHIYFCKPVFRPRFQFAHWMWDDGDASYDFSDCEEDALPIWKVFWFRGRVRKFKQGFAKRYSENRNRKKGRR